MNSGSSGAALPAWLSILLWISLGTSMIMFNKVLLTTWGFHYPFFLTCWHCVLSSILTQVLARTTQMLPGVSKGTVTRNDYIMRILPMSLCFALSLVFGNMAYKYISLAYIQMVKAFTPVPLLLLSFVSGLEKPSLVLFCIVLVVSAGVTLSSFGELKFSTLGFLVQLSAVFADCFRMIILNLMLKDLNLDSLSLLYYTSPPSAVLIFAGHLMFEASTFDMAIFTPALTFMLLLNGLLAFSLNIAVIYLVSRTSVMVMSISGPIKDILIVVISVVVFKAPITMMQLVGFCVSLVGLLLYREYKSDPKRMIELCTSTALCDITCAYLMQTAGESTSISSAHHGASSPGSPTRASGASTVDCKLMSPMHRPPGVSQKQHSPRSADASGMNFADVTTETDGAEAEGDVELAPLLSNKRGDHAV